MALIQITAPSQEPVTLAEVKEQLSIDIVTDDDLLELYIKTSRHQAEHKMKRQIMNATWKFIFDDFANSTAVVYLGRPPLSTVSSNLSIEYLDDDNTTQTVGSTVYIVDSESQPGRIYPDNGNEWPTDINTDVPGSIRITFQSGYTSKQNVPEEIKQWIKMRVGMFYEFREPVTSDRFTGLDRMYFDALLDPYMEVTVDR